MHLEGDETGRIAVVAEIDARFAVEPHADVGAVGFDLHLVPLVDLGQLAALHRKGEGFGGLDTRREPAAAAFFIKSSSPLAGGAVGLVHVLRVGVDLGLVAVDTAGGDLDHLAGGVVLVVDVLDLGVAANLHAGVQARIVEEFIFQDEVRVVLIGREERVRRVGDGRADEVALGADGIFGRAALGDETSEVLAVEDLDLVRVGLWCAGGGRSGVGGRGGGLRGAGLGSVLVIAGAARDEEGGGRGKAQGEQGLFHGVCDLV